MYEKMLNEAVKDGGRLMGRKKNVVRRVCGIIMPISTMKVGDLTYSEEYWKGVLGFLIDTIKEAGFEPTVAWENDKSDVIHAKIVQNIESHDVMIAVLVGNNPNVWLECGMRLWTEKPLVLLVSDKLVRIPFDVSPVNCLRFPEDCHYGKLKDLKRKLKELLKQITREGHPSILSHFAKLQPTSTSPAVKKVELESFMTETRDAISKLQSRIQTLQSVAWLSADIGRAYHSQSAAHSAIGQRVSQNDDFPRVNENVTCIESSFGLKGPTGPTIS